MKPHLVRFAIFLAIMWGCNSPKYVGADIRARSALRGEAVGCWALSLEHSGSYAAPKFIRLDSIERTNSPDQSGARPVARLDSSGRVLLTDVERFSFDDSWVADSRSDKIRIVFSNRLYGSVWVLDLPTANSSATIHGLTQAFGDVSPPPDYPIEKVHATRIECRKPADSKLDSLIAGLAQQVRPVDSSFASLPSTMRADSGSVRADSVLLALEASLTTQVREVVRTFDDSTLQVILWPNGAYGQQFRRAAGRAGEPPSAEELLVADSVRRFLLQHGIWAYIAEGDGYFVLSLDRLATHANPFVSDAAREALRIQTREQVVPTGGDAAVSISWDELGDRLATTDRFLATYSNAPARARIQALRARYLDAFLTGWDNTSVFEGSGNGLRADVRKSYERYVEVHAGTLASGVVRAYLDVLAGAGYRRTQAVDAFLRAQASR